VTAVVAIGECMLELVRVGAGWQLNYAGDTFNTAITLRRLGVPVAYLTALGADPFSQEMRAGWQREGIDVSMVLTDPTRLPGLYAIRTDAAGERSFYYWRERSAVRRLFELEGVEDAMARIADSRLLYLSGITLSIFQPPQRERLLEIAGAVRSGGGQVVFDPNYRVAGWPDALVARAEFQAFAALASIVMPTFADEALLFGDATPERTVERYRHWGAQEVVVKLAARGCLVATPEQNEYVAPSMAVTALDSSGAGDAFNAAYLAARLAGRGVSEAARVGNLLAGEVVRYSGAVLPIERLAPLKSLMEF
jgi:2-dehydro-3-deoxygluconokinase